MSEIQYDDYIGGLMFKTGLSTEMVSYASQEMLLQRKRPWWQPTHASRNTFLPHWERPEIFRTLNTINTQGILLKDSCNVEQKVYARPSGKLGMDLVDVKARVTLSDRELYHHNVQRLFCLFAQFDTMTDYHIRAFLSLSSQDCDYATSILHSQNIIKRAYDWEFEKELGRLWVLNRKVEDVYQYQLGLDPAINLMSFGGFNLSDSKVPGSGSSNAIRHNLFMTETSLRLAETADNVVGVWGDLFVGEHMFHEPNPHAQKTRNSHGDAAVTTKDGSVIVFEMVGASESNLKQFKVLSEKAASWIGVISDSDIDLNVLFIAASWNRDRRVLYQAIDRAIRHDSYLYSSNEMKRQQALNHIGIVDLNNWYPDDFTVSQAETRLAAWCVNEKKMKAFDIPDTNFSSTTIRENIVINSAVSMHNPSWIRGDFHDRKFK